MHDTFYGMGVYYPRLQWILDHVWSAAEELNL